MSDQEMGKKMVEEEAFYQFADAYEDVTGDRLDIVAKTERPDFICSRSDGSHCGVELTEIRRDPETALWDQVVHREETMSASDASARIYEAVDSKDRKRRQSDWKFPNDTILIVQLMDCPLQDLEWAFDDHLIEDLRGHGFSEIWVADFTTIEAFGEVQLYCIAPEDERGLYPRAHPDKKPFG